MLRLHPTPVTSESLGMGSGHQQWLKFPGNFNKQNENQFVHVTETWGNEGILHQPTNVQTHLSTCFVQDTPRDCEIGELQKLEASIGREDKPMGKM